MTKFRHETYERKLELQHARENGGTIECFHFIKRQWYVWTDAIKPNFCYRIKEPSV